jgi:amidase
VSEPERRGVTAAAPPDPSATAIWRVVGDPLVPGSPDGPLSGSRVAVKDLYAVAGQRIGGGNPERLAEAPVESEHAWAVRALLEAGADVVGIAQTDELAFSLFGTNKHYGAPPNPAAPGRITGGSSNGPVAAVALGQADIGLGTDTGGSVRVPASYCGLYGIRTTHGAVPVDGVQPLAPAFDTVGWLTADPATLERAGDVLLPPAPITPVRTALLADDVTALADPDVRTAFTAACHDLADRTGIALETTESLCDGHLEEWFWAFRTVQSAEAWDCQGDWVSAHPGSLGPGVASRFAFGESVTPERRAAAKAGAEEARAALRARLEPETVLLIPASSSTAPPLDMSLQVKEEVRAASLRLTCLSSLSGLPAVVLPLLSVDGLPAGLCAIGAADTDRSLLRLASAREESASTS